MSATTVSCVPEYSAVSFQETKEIHVNTRIQAPALPVDVPSTSRAPLSLTAVIDRSGSMSGTKLKLVKETLQFVLSSLNEDDTFGVISYSDSVTTTLPLLPMNENGKRVAERNINQLTAGGATNLSGGLVAGINQQVNPTQPPAPIPLMRRQTPSSTSFEVEVGNLFMGNTWVAFVKPTTTHTNAKISQVTFTLPHTFEPSVVNLSSPPFEMAQTVPTTAPLKIAVDVQHTTSGVTQTTTHVFHHTLGFSSAITSKLHQLPLTTDSAVSVPKSDKKATVKAVWLFTDGLANRGVQGPAIVTQAESILQRTKNVTISTFGYGSDHDAKLLRDLSESGHGMYYFLDNPMKIGEAMVECLGGLLSVVAQNVKLHIKACPGAQALTVSTKFRCQKQDGCNSVVFLGDLYAEEKRDILCTVRLNSLPCAITNEVPLVTATLELTDDVNEKCSMQDTCSITRPIQTPPQAVPAVISEQLNRVKAMEAMDKAKQFADRGNMREARVELQAAKECMMGSSTANTTYVRNLVEDVSDMMSGMQDASRYAAFGQQQAVQVSNMWAHERACGAAKPRFQNVQQQQMVGAWNVLQQQQPQPMVFN
eukprot:TRINITY_DN95396_c0_g1_i1.p1 TRINITY_DN95396_c0_g1~~TRINITY_DN95396_c0_g1_i1.p1  ORF type:complete len:593 (-),score=86.00 TRINITY_DN95396_c0_g1_i1:75-1853(-)